MWLMIKSALVGYSFEESTYKLHCVCVCFESELHLCLSISLLRWCLMDCFLWTDHEGFLFIFCMPLMLCIPDVFASERLYARAEILCRIWVNHTPHRNTHLRTKVWKESDEGLFWQAEEAAAALGLVQSQEDGGWRREREEVQDIDLAELQVQTGHNRHKLSWETDRPRRPAVLLILSVNLGRIGASFIIIFSWVTAEERWNTLYAVYQSSCPLFPLLLKEELYWRGALTGETTGPHDVMDKYISCQ